MNKVPREDECENCGKKLNPKRTVRLEHCNLDAEYYFIDPNNPMPEEFSQGAFSFGTDCAKKVGKIWKGIENVIS